MLNYIKLFSHIRAFADAPFPAPRNRHEILCPEHLMRRSSSARLLWSRNGETAKVPIMFLAAARLSHERQRTQQSKEAKHSVHDAFLVE